MGLLSTAKKVATGLLDMDTPSRMARAKEQGYLWANPLEPESIGYSTKVITNGSPEAVKFSKYLSEKGIPHKSHKAKTGSTYITIQGDPYQTMQGNMSLGDLEYRFSDHSKDQYKKMFDNQKVDNYFEADVFPNGHTLEDAIRKVESTGGIRSVDAAFDPAKISSSNLLASRPEAAIGGLLALTAMGASEDADAGVVSSGVRIAKEILNLRAQGRANEVTNEMMSYADPQYLFDNTPLPMDAASRLNRAEGGGFDTNVPLYHSGNKEIESINPDFKASFGGEKGAFYTTTNPDVANTYGGDIMQQFYGKTPEDALIVDAHNRGFYELDKETVTSQGALGDVVPQQFDKWSSGHRSIGRPELIHTDMVSAGYPSDTTVFNRLKDEGAYNRIDPEDEFYDGTPSTVRADQNATNLRSTSARFDPEFSHLSNTLASNPVATAAGLGGVLAMTGSDDSYAGGTESQYDPTSMSGVLGISPEMIEAMAQRDALDQQRMADREQRYGQYANDQMMPREQTYSEQLGNYLSNLRYGDDSSRQQQEMARVLGGILDFTPVGSADALKLGAQQRDAGNSFEGWLNSIGGAAEAAIPLAGLGYKYGKKGVQGLMEAF